ncbi:MAG: PaeR7I family type II restriction endonuclease [bacterium]|nr:PaeR7I family type II restriction endonuclease [bacterium]
MSKPKLDLDDLNDLVDVAVQSFWGVRSSQGKKQGRKSGKSDRGGRKSVTAGKHLDGVVDMIRIVVERHCPSMAVHVQAWSQDPSTMLPGFFRPTKYWDVVVKHGDRLAAVIELKSHVGSFGNNYNNRCEEAIGTGYDMKVAYREKMFHDSPPPWVGFWMLLQDCDASTKAKGAPKLSHFDVDPMFDGASYAKRYEVTLERLVHDRLYQNACLILSDIEGKQVNWREPNASMSVRSFVGGLIGHLIGFEASA